MTLIVQKYGGTSVGTVERIREVARKVSEAAKDNRVVIVLSAMAGETDRLIGLAKQLSDRVNSREYSVLVSTGEQVSVALLCIALHERGLRARSMTAYQLGIQTDEQHKNARIVQFDKQQLVQCIEQGEIPIVAGFQGVNTQGDVATLGRGGSDTTAVAVATALNADECQIYTDVDGVYTADPRVVPSARRLSHISMEEMLELSSLGAKVLQPRAVEFAGKYQVPLRVLSSFKPGPGTLITFEGNKMEQPIVAGVAYNRNEAKFTIRGVPDTPGVAHDILGPISAAKIDIDMIIQNVGADGSTDFTFTVHRDEVVRGQELLRAIGDKLGAREISINDKIAKISLVGVGMRSHAGVASTMFKALGEEGINIQLISTSEIKISVVVDEKYLELGVRTLHSAFELDSDPSEEFDPAEHSY